MAIPTLDTLPSTIDIWGLNKDKVEVLRRLISRLDTPATAASSSALTGNVATALNASATPSDDPWVIDSGASDHMTGMSPLFSSYNPCSCRDKVRIADGSLSPISGKGFVSVTPSMTLAFVLHVTNLVANLLSIARSTIELNCRVISYFYYCFFQVLATRKMIGSGSLKDGLYYLDSQPDTHGWLIQAYHTIRADDSTARIWLWHQRLGHPFFLILQRMFPALFLHNNVSKFQCETCELSKHHRVSFSPSINKSDAPFVLVHTDVWGPSRVVSLSGYRWFVYFIDDFSRTTWVYLLKDKSDMFSMFRCFIRWFKLSLIPRLKLFVLTMEVNICLVISKHIFASKALFTKPRVDTPQQNGVAEQENWHLLEVTRSLMLDTHVPKSYWGDALLTTTYLINRMPSRILDFKTPLEVLSLPFSTSKGISPKFFGCVCFVHIHGHTRSKLDPQSFKCVFVGYSPTQKG
jgi:hypothetical protein